MIKLHISRANLMLIEKKMKMLGNNSSYLFKLMEDIDDSSIRNNRKDFIILKELIILLVKKCFVRENSRSYDIHMPVFLKKSCIFGQKQFENFMYDAYSQVANPADNFLDIGQQKVFGLFVCNGDKISEHYNCDVSDIPEIVFKFTNDYFLVEKLDDSKKYDCCCIKRG